MSKDARAKAAEPSAAVRAKIRELAELMARERCAGGGLPPDVTFSQIEEWGHQAGQLVAAAVDQQLVDQHRDQLAAEQPCPQCGALIQRIRYAENETNYCAECQNEGRILADRSLSRLLKGDFPRGFDDD